MHILPTVLREESLQLHRLQTELREKRRKKDQKQITDIKKKPDTVVTRPADVSKVLFVARGVWPFDFIPDELIIEEKRIVVKKNYFPFGSSIVSLPIKRLYTFELTKSLFLSGLHIRGEALGNADMTMQYLTHKDAMEAKDLVDGLRMKESESLEILTDDRAVFTRTIEAMGQT